MEAVQCLDWSEKSLADAIRRMVWEHGVARAAGGQHFIPSCWKGTLTQHMKTQRWDLNTPKALSFPVRDSIKLRRSCLFNERAKLPSYAVISVQMKTLRTVNVKQTTKCSSARCGPGAGILEFTLTALWRGPALLCAEMIENVMNQKHNLALSQHCHYRKRLNQMCCILEISINTVSVPIVL